MKNLVKNLFTENDLAMVASAIGEAEKKTAGEIRVSVRQKRRWQERKLSIEELTRREFQMLGMMKTRDRTGILILLVLEDKKFFILADEGIHARVDENTWVNIADDMSTLFIQKEFRKGIVLGVQAVGEVLAKFFPRKPDDTNEIPNDVHIR